MKNQDTTRKSITIHIDTPEVVVTERYVQLNATDPLCDALYTLACRHPEIKRAMRKAVQAMYMAEIREELKLN